jgi:DNA-binding phage protein
MEIEIQLQEKYQSLKEHLNERARRIWAATEARVIGRGGVTSVSRATGLARTVIYAGLRELDDPETVPLDRIRKSGGGRKQAGYHNPEFYQKVEGLVEPVIRGDPQSALRWTCKSVRKLSEELKKEGISVGYQTVAKALHDLGYTLQSTKKCISEGGKHPDRNAQFEHINEVAGKALKRGNPVISVDTKKKELIGPFENKGKEWHEKKKSEKVADHDFPTTDIPRAHPYGIYDINRNEGFVNIGNDHDTAQFAVASIRAWWNKVGKQAYPKGKRIQIMADSGGSNSSSSRLWKRELQRLADESGLTIGVCHFPPGTSKWNKIEHRLFSFISINWRGKPLTSFETMIKLICSTTTSKGLKVYCQLDRNEYPTKIKVSDREMKTIRLFPNSFHGEWNYDIKPHKT